ETGREGEPLFDNGDQDIDGDSDPHLGAHGVFGRAIEGFDTQMLLDPFEEQFDLPTAAVELSDRQGWFGEIVGQEHEPFAGLRVAEADAPQRLRKLLAGTKARQHYSLVEEQPGGFVHWMRVAPLETGVLLG